MLCKLQVEDAGRFFLASRRDRLISHSSQSITILSAPYWSDAKRHCIVWRIGRVSSPETWQLLVKSSSGILGTHALAHWPALHRNLVRRSTWTESLKRFQNQNSQWAKRVLFKSQGDAIQDQHTALHNKTATQSAQVLMHMNKSLAWHVCMKATWHKVKKCKLLLLVFN
jgi:hypothetical protein